MSSSLQKLLSYADKGFLFHGSPKAGLSLLNPMNATDTNKENTFNKDTAIFATDNICIPIIFGLIDPRALPKTETQRTWSVGGDKINAYVQIVAKAPKQWKEHIELSQGYVYVLPKDTFLESDGMQWKSKSPVTPKDCVKVCLQDFYALGGKIEWMN